jgi:glycosyltransferase involved in cell wall biosynthesis
MKEIVSICIPTYNGATYLAKTIDSVLAQTFSNFEVLIVDDQSEDDTLEIARSYAARDLRIRLVQNPGNLGLVGNWNRCIELAKGEWIKFIFQDDLLVPECLNKMIGFHQNSSGKEKVIFCKRDYIFENLNDPHDLNLKMNKVQFFWDFFPNTIRITPLDTIKIITKWSGRNIFGEPSSYLIHRDVFDRFGLFDPNFHHICDNEYWFRIGVNLNVLMIPETLVHFRVHEKSTTNFNRREKWLQMRYLDRVRLFRKFMHDVSYHSLREEMRIWPCSMYLKTQTAILARRAKLDVKAEKNIQWEKDFLTFCQEYSNVTELANTNYFILAFRYVLSKFCLKIKWATDSIIAKLTFSAN